ncbi:putative DUTP pyrophosphatase [Oopsacas minuta]|uniref:Deoxyuridine 5'-triphosphate nucleotidohydrolase n=1 Tax=Oopsacas minuta TaxID=111878 RepID=A0AAV7JWI2_9METZ|nr:putative DUTP pyrophosphatase [Oopsacas minuta]
MSTTDTEIEPSSTTATMKSPPKRKLQESEEPSSKKIRTDNETNIEKFNDENSSYVLRVKKHNKNAKLPYRSSTHAAGYDLYASDDVIVPANGKILVPTGISLQIPLGYYGRVAPRSGLALNYHLDVGAGVIDADYRGQVGILLFNFSKEDYQVKIGTKIAQLLLEKIITPLVEEVDDLESTDRGEGGFGSTGISDSEPTKEN